MLYVCVRDKRTLLTSFCYSPCVVRKKNTSRWTNHARAVTKRAVNKMLLPLAHTKSRKVFAPSCPKNIKHAWYSTYVPRLTEFTRKVDRIHEQLAYTPVATDEILLCIALAFSSGFFIQPKPVDCNFLTLGIWDVPRFDNGILPIVKIPCQNSNAWK